MRIARMNWLQVGKYLKEDDRVVLPLGSVEQHAYLSLATDAILAERVSVDAADPLGIPVYPALPYGLTPYFMGYPGTVTLRPSTYARVVHDLLDSMAESGFRRIALVNGHGGNSTVESVAASWGGSRPEVRVLFHNWWKAPRTWSKARTIDPVGSHASWMENFPWTRLAEVTLPEGSKEQVSLDDRARLSPAEVRARLGDGSFGGYYERSDQEMMQLWAVAVQELRALLDGSWEEEDISGEGDVRDEVRVGPPFDVTES